MSPRASIIAYHAIGACSKEQDHHKLFVSTENFARQIEFLLRHRSVIDLESVMRGPVVTERPAVAITFDDGYRSVLTAAVPILRRHGLTATIFVPTAYLGGANTWDKPSECDFGIMTAEELREIDASGVTVQSHGHAHIDMASAEESTVRSDIQTSLERLESVIGRRPRYLAYPFGHESPGARAAAKDCGLDGAFTINAPGRDPFAFERIPITPLDGPRLFAFKTSGRYLGLRWSAPVRGAYALVKPLVRRTLGA